MVERRAWLPRLGSESSPGPPGPVVPRSIEEQAKLVKPEDWRDAKGYGRDAPNSPANSSRHRELRISRSLVDNERSFGIETRLTCEDVFVLFDDNRTMPRAPQA